jgi:hypothetical protein
MVQLLLAFALLLVGPVADAATAKYAFTVLLSPLISLFLHPSSILFPKDFWILFDQFIR